MNIRSVALKSREMAENWPKALKRDYKIGSGERQ